MTNNQGLYDKAATLFMAIPEQHISFTMPMALASCGASLDLAQSRGALSSLRQVIDVWIHKLGPPAFSFTDESILHRAKIIASSALYLPDWQLIHNRAVHVTLEMVMVKNKQKGLVKADILRFAGARDNQVKGGKFNVAIGRFMKKLKFEE